MLLASLAARMKGVHPDIVVDPKKSMYRIHRDVRFSQDKSPYKTWVAASFTCDGHDRKYDAAFYFHITPEEIGIGGGLYAPSGDKLKKLRAAIAQDAKPLRNILADKKFREQFGEMEGEELQRAPQGYDPEHPDMDLLRKKQFLCWKTLPTGRATEADFLEDLVSAFTAMVPFIMYLLENS
ncbi:MAG: DUF2461 domain-containing protein, partial [Bacteroidetes bacterium]|nr:DUF2461 domain-containing protein [Bacteroidota bacterium]